MAPPSMMRRPERRRDVVIFAEAADAGAELKFADDSNGRARRRKVSAVFGRRGISPAPPHASASVNSR